MKTTIVVNDQKRRVDFTEKKAGTAMVEVSGEFNVPGFESLHSTKHVVDADPCRIAEAKMEIVEELKRLAKSLRRQSSK